MMVALQYYRSGNVKSVHRVIDKNLKRKCTKRSIYKPYFPGFLSVESDAATLLPASDLTSGDLRLRNGKL